AVAQMQDFLELDSWARMNIPSTVGGNWQWRMVGGELTDELAERIRSLTETYGRIVPEPEPEKPTKSQKAKKVK
ncbi:MAG: 4-alpha-glucanotransferase, partial [Ruminococcus sp.]|nr:4-alpha-glucanotransferase [Ruminococcus sp.]